MKSRIGSWWRPALALAGLALAVSASPAAARTLYVAPDDAQTADVFLWDGEPVTDMTTMTKALLEVAKTAEAPVEPLEIRLLAREGAAETLFRPSGRPFFSARGWRGAKRAPLILRGQVDRSGAVPRALTVIEGPTLRETLCRDNEAVCAGFSGTKVASLDGLAPSTLEKLDADAKLANLPQRSIGTQRTRFNCVHIADSHYVHVRDLGLRDCWLPGVLIDASTNIAVRGNVIEGSSYAVVAFAAVDADGKPMPESAHTFEITGNRWTPSTASYKPPRENCDVTRDWDCPVSIWDDLPWGVVHHYFWEPLNGALFGAKDILGNVRVAGNVVIDAYNGVRPKVSRKCLEIPECEARTNIGFEITGNIFDRVRDNPIEPEKVARQWIVKGNTFLDNHGVISTDGVGGGDFFVFGNLYDFTRLPARNCRDGIWSDSRQLLLATAKGTRDQWSPSIAEATAEDPLEADTQECGSHRRGTFVKSGWQDGEDSPGRMLDRIYVFNNSLRLRGPIFARRPSSPISSFNNAVEFPDCRQGCNEQVIELRLDSDVSCLPFRRLTADGRFLHSDCFNLEPENVPGYGMTKGPHAFAHNGFNQPLAADIAAAERNLTLIEGSLFAPAPAAESLGGRIEARFRLPAGSPLATAGCALTFDAATGLACQQGTAGALVGALAPDGKRFDFALPFGYPFEAALRYATP